MVINGKAIAEQIYTELMPRVAGRNLVLGLITAGANEVTRSFINIKKRNAERLGVSVERIDLSPTADTGEVIDAIANISPKVHGLIVQLPLPSTVHTETVILAIPTNLDVDALNFMVLDKDRFVIPPVAGAVLEVLKHGGVDPRGKHVVVVGEGRLVGSPVAEVLKERGALVTHVTRTKGNLKELLHADVVVSGAGAPHFIKPEMVRDGAILIDAGTSEMGGSVVGDIDPACAEKASIFTPTPGGIGPIAVACIFKNLLTLAELNPDAKT